MMNESENEPESQSSVATNSNPSQNTLPLMKSIGVHLHHQFIHLAHHFMEFIIFHLSIKMKEIKFLFLETITKVHWKFSVDRDVDRIKGRIK